MQDLIYRTLDDGTDALMERDLAELSRALRGRLLTPADGEYETARQVWNGMVDRRPALIARCISPEDVPVAVDFARNHRMRTSIRGGGHHIAGNALAEGGLVIDLSGMRRVEVDTGACTARAQGGALLKDVDGATQAQGLATPLGINSTTGLAGLCLGGGFGWLTRAFGLTVDNLTAVDLVSADGQPRRVSAESESDLFWAIRGGGGNFGVVTAFELKLHPVGPELSTGLAVFPLAEGRAVLRAWRDFIADAPRELSVWAILRKAPPLPFLPASVHGQDVVVLVAVYAGDRETGERLIAPLPGLGPCLGSHLGPQPYTQLQCAFDPLLTPGARNYWKSHNFREIADGAVEAVADAAGDLPGPECELFIGHLGGRAAEVPVAATAYTGRDANFVMNVHGRWQDPDDDGRMRDWARRVYRDTAPFATGGGYVNFMTADEDARVAGAYGENLARLRAVKRRFDPDNLFRVNQNILPAETGENAAAADRTRSA